MTRMRAKQAHDLHALYRAEGLDSVEAKAKTAKEMGITLSTVNRYLREIRYEDALHPTVIKPRYTVTQVLPQDDVPVRVMAIGDAHDSPRLDKERFRWMGAHARSTNPTAIIQIGDMLTLDSLCEHVKNDTYEGRFKPTFSEDIVSADMALRAFNEGLDNFSPASKHITLGNHEHRTELFANKHPEVYGMMAETMYRLLDKHGWTYSPFGEMYMVGGVGFVHVPLNEMGGRYGGKTAEQRVANDTVHDVVFGHSHRYRFHHAAKVGGRSVNVMNLGCAMPDGHVEEYAKHSATGWTYGIVDMVIENGQIADHEFITMKELEKRYG